MSLTRRLGIELIAVARAIVTPPAPPYSQRYSSPVGALCKRAMPPAPPCSREYPPGPRSARACSSRVLCFLLHDCICSSGSPEPEPSHSLCFLLHHTREDTENLLVNRLMSLSWAVARGPVPCVPQLGRVGGTSFSLLPSQKNARGKTPARQ